MNHMIIATKQLRQKEIVGHQDNPEILKYFHELGLSSDFLKDETAWCSAFVNWVCKTAGLEWTPELNARSHLDYGTEVEIPEYGDKVIFWRGKHKDEYIAGTNLKKGHVGFYIREQSGWILTLGGNQGNEVSDQWYLKSKLLGYRRMT